MPLAEIQALKPLPDFNLPHTYRGPAITTNDNQDVSNLVREELNGGGVLLPSTAMDGWRRTMPIDAGVAGRRARGRQS